MTDEQTAVGLYAVLNRDVCDFLDMVQEASDGSLKILYEMLTYHVVSGEQSDKTDCKLNDMGATLVLGQLKKRGITI